MANSVMQIRIDDELRAHATAVFDQLGIDIPTAVRMFLKRAVIENGMPFQMTLPRNGHKTEPGNSSLMQPGDKAEKYDASEMSPGEIRMARLEDAGQGDPADDGFETRRVFSERNEENNIRYKVIYRKSRNWYEIWTDERTADNRRVRHQVKNEDTEQIKHDKEKTIQYVREKLL